MVVSLLAALGSAFCYGIACVLQAISVRAASRRPEAEAEATYRAVLKRWKPKTWLSQFIEDEKAAAE